MAEVFPLPRSSLKLLRLILIGYLHEGGNDRKPAGPSAIGATVGLDPTVVSRNNAFLAAVDLIEAAENRRWRLTEAGVDVARAFEYEAMEELHEALSRALRGNEFVQRVTAFVRSRGGVEEEQVVSHMARLAGVRRAADFLTGARAFLELITLGGLVESDGQMVRATAARPTPVSETRTDRVINVEGIGREEGVGTPAVRVGRAPVASGVAINLNFGLTAKDLASDAAVDELAARLNRLLNALAAK